MYGFIGMLFLGFIAVVVILGVVGLLLRKRNGAEKSGEEVLSQKIVDNVNDLNDQFNRARYMVRDGK